MKILVTGAAGYIGFPLMLKLTSAGHGVIGVDNGLRADWVARIDPKSGYKTIPFPDIITADLTDRDLVDELLKIHKPDCIIHSASQPSMPYSDLSWERALFTQINNLAMNLNILWGIKSNNLVKTKYIILTTTGIAGQFYQLVPERNTLNNAGSWYHISRGFDSENCNLAHRVWGLNIIELRTAIVYGLTTKELNSKRMTTRFDTDPYFGTAINRFMNQASKGQELTIYGKGMQSKPFISLEDCCVSILNAVEQQFENGHHIFNQTTECVSIKTIAELIGQEFNVPITHIENPRKEKEDFYMQFDNSLFLKLLGQPRQLIADGIKEMARVLKERKY